MRVAQTSALIAILATTSTGDIAAQAIMPPGQGPAFQGFVWEGGSGDDRGFAEMASGLVKGKPCPDPQFDLVLKAIRATDRFKSVEGSFGPDGIAHIRLQPWALLQSWAWQGDALSKKTKLLLFPDLKKGLLLGDLRLEEWRRKAEAKLRDEGNPQARLAVGRDASGTQLVLTVELGGTSLVRRVAVSGNTNPYKLEALLKVAEIQVDKTVWTQDLRRKAALKIHRRFVKDKRLEGRVELSFTNDGTLALSIDPGPVVNISSTGKWITQRKLKELVPLARLDRYSPELLDEGDRRIIRYYRDKGYLDVESTHVREVVAGSPTHPQEVHITYRIQTGERRYAKRILFEGNQELSNSELTKAADLPRGLLWFNSPRATPDLLNEIETRITNRYLSMGFSDVKIRRRVETRGGAEDLVLTIREGPRRTVRAIILELPEGTAWDPWKFGENLLRVIADKPTLLSPAFSQRHRYQTDRRELNGLIAILELLPSELDKPKKAVRLLTEKPIPYVRADLAAVLGELNKDVAALGIPNPIVRSHFEEDDAGAIIRIEIPPQPLTFVRRRVVQGSLETKAIAVARETTDVGPGDPLNNDRLGRAQANLYNLGAFKRVDASSLKDAGEAASSPESASPWNDGDLVFNLEEHSHWVFTESFRYDKSTGYNFGFGVQRLNFQGMGRTLEFGISAGDATIDNPTLRRWFPTGDFSRSVDSFTLGYTDPRFSPRFLAKFLPDRVQYHAEASYVQEQETSYLIRRRRFLNTLEWKLDPTRVIRVGYRFERADTRLVDLVDLNTPQYESIAYIFENPDDLLNKATGSPSKATVSAPFAQWVRDTRDSSYDPTSGVLSSVRLDLALQMFGTSSNSSFVKLDARQQWTWPIGYRASAGVMSLGLRIGAALPTAKTSQDLPLSERFFAGGQGTFRGSEPNFVGPQGSIPFLRQTSDGKYAPQLTPDGKSVLYELIPIGGQGLALVNLEYRFPLIGSTFWGEVFMDVGQVYERIHPEADAVTPFPPLRVAFGLGIILKLGFPIKIEYGSDWKRILGRPRSDLDRVSELHTLLISAGYQF